MKGYFDLNLEEILSQGDPSPAQAIPLDPVELLSCGEERISTV